MSEAKPEKNLSKIEAIEALTRALMPFADDYFEGDIISMTDVKNARKVIDQLLRQADRKEAKRR